jgi:hypothetical protein
MTLEDELRALLQDVRPTSEQEQRFLATAAREASHQQQQRRTRRMVVVPAVAAGCVAAVAVGVSSVDWGGHTPPDQHPSVVTVSPTPPPTPTPTPTPSATPSGYQPIPGVSAERAAAIVSGCSQGIFRGSSSILDIGKATLEDFVENAYGGAALIDVPLRAGAKPAAHIAVPNFSNTLLFTCQLRPDDTVEGAGYGGIRYQGHAIPAPVWVDGSSGVGAPTSGKPLNAISPQTSVIEGRVARNVARIVWDMPDGRHVPAEIRNGFFLTNPAQVSGGNLQGELRGYDSAGHVLAVAGPYGQASGHPPAIYYWP